jgi:hypothetical protein
MICLALLSVYLLIRNRAADPDMQHVGFHRQGDVMQRGLKQFGDRFW